MKASVIDTRQLFSLVDAELIDLLRSLSPADWQLPTLASKWTVKDVASHLLDGNIRAISMRPGHLLPAPSNISTYRDLVDYLNDLNAQWVTAMKRVAPYVLLEWLESSGKAYCEHIAGLSLYEKAPFPVSWAGETESMNWFHIAREYTEKMHHQLQIRHAVNREEKLLEPKYFHPFISTLLLGIPHALRNIEAEDGTVIRIKISTNAGGTWQLRKEAGGWSFIEGTEMNAASEIEIPPSIAWKVFTKGMDAGASLPFITYKGKADLCMAVLQMVAVMA